MRCSPNVVSSDDDVDDDPLIFLYFGAQALQTLGGTRRIRPSYNCGRNTSRSGSLGEKHLQNYSAGGFTKNH
jgi:hypothetical protein